MKNPFEHITRAYQGRHDSELLRPFADFYWHSLVVIAMLVSIGSIIYGTLKYFEAERILDETPTAETTANPEAAYDSTGLMGAIEYYQKRQSQYELNKLTAPVLVDPSR